ncbi:MAG: AAA family ATPase [Acidobacteriota bacterium]|nr:AAA family ATPase [Acidobacteriota bacterium]
MNGTAFPGFERAATGIAGLDQVMGGGFPIHRMYLIEGSPGAGKTTLAMQFLIEGARRGEPGVYATLSETEEELRDVARAHGWSLDGITICDLQTAEESLKADSQYTLFHPSEVELSETTRTVLQAVELVQPTRVVFDSLSEMRLLARDSLRYRRQILSLKHYFTGRRCTVLLLDYVAEAAGDFQLQSLTHGVLRLEQLAPEYGGSRRRLRIQKLRGVRFGDGFHDYNIKTGGMVVYPRLIAAESPASELQPDEVSSGLPELDTLLGRGIPRGTSTMLLGPAGCGKSTLTMQYVAAAAARGERSVIYTFDEFPATWIARGLGMGMDLLPHLAAGTISIRRVDPAELSPGEFADVVTQAVDEHARLVVIDSLNGYRNAMPEERFLGLHMRELLCYLNQRGVLTLMVLTQHGLLGSLVEAPVELSYLADNVILLRYFEAFGEVRQAISVVKKRTGNHERSIRELRFGPGGIRIGSELRDFQGVLSGQLEYLGETGPLLHRPMSEQLKYDDAQ